ncbi:MAG: FAD-dependent oxidoreductase [Cyclobacteriaceae bacterium]
MKIKVDHIIVGQGLAGSCLALQLISRKKEIVIFDEPSKNRSSSVAAGLFNPISGKWMTKAWMADEVFPELFSFYHEAEKELHSNFFYPRPVYRPFISIEEQNEWMARSADRGLKDFIEIVYLTSAYGEFTDDLFGGVLTKYSGYLDVNGFVGGVKRLLVEREILSGRFF